MRMRPARPLDPPIDLLKSKSVDQKGSRTTTTKKKKRGARPPPTRARRKTIDPLRWGSMQLSGIFLDNDEDPPPPQRESTEVEEVEHILDISDQTPSPYDDDTHPHASGAELDLAAERASALDLLGTIFGEASDDWGGAESIDSDVEMNGIPHVAPGPLESTGFEVVPADHEFHPAQREKKKSAVNRQSESTPPPATTNLAQLSNQNKLKDLFAPREEEGELLAIYAVVSFTNSFTGFSLIGHLDLDSELDLDLELNQDAPAFPSTAVSVPTSSRSALSAPIAQHKALDPSLPLFFPQKGHVQMVRFARTEDEAVIRARWEAARGELTREWKRRHREAVKSRRRRGGEQVE